MGQQQEEKISVLAEVTFTFRPEHFKALGKERTFRQVGITQQGPFMKVLPGPGSDIDTHELFHFDVVAAVSLVPPKLQVTSEMPPLDKS